MRDCALLSVYLCVRAAVCRFEDARGELGWSEVFSFDYAPLAGLSMSVRIPNALNQSIVLAMDVALPDLNPIVQALDLVSIGCAVAVVEPNMEEQPLILSSGDPAAYTINTNGTAQQLSAKHRFVPVCVRACVRVCVRVCVCACVCHCVCPPPLAARMRTLSCQRSCLRSMSLPLTAKAAATHCTV